MPVCFSFMAEAESGFLLGKIRAMMSAQVFCLHRAEEKLVKSQPGRNRAQSTSWFRKSRERRRKSLVCDSLPGDAHLQEPRRVILLDHFQAVLHQACGLA